MDISNLTLTQTKFRSGYDQQDVDQFLEVAAANLLLPLARRTLGAKQVSEVCFKSTLLRAGYEQEEVDAVLDQLAVELGKPLQSELQDTTCATTTPPPDIPNNSGAIPAPVLNAPSRRRRALWAAGFVLAGALFGAGALAGALAVSGMFTTGDVQLRVPNYGYGPAPDYVLELKRVGADAEPKDPHGTLNMLGLSKDGLRQYEDVSELSVWSGVSRYGTACLLVAHPGQGLLEGIGDAQCSPDGRDAIAEVTLCSGCSAPGDFGDLPSGSLIRFVLKGNRVDVYVYVRAPDPSASQGEPGAAP